MTPRAIIVIGGSSGALEALRQIVMDLPREFDAAVFVAIHTSPDTPGMLDRILTRAGIHPAQYAVDREPIQAGRIYLAPPDRHLLVMRQHVRVTRGPRENHFRPAIDPLFRTAALAYGPNVIGIVLSGGQDDGAVGLGLVKRAGGIAIVQDPADAILPSMPEAALRHVDIDHVLAPADMSTMVSGLIPGLPAIKEVAMSEQNRDVAESGAHDIHRAERLGPPSPFTCPDCGGTLWESQNGDLLQFQCHVGHRYSGDTLASAQSDALDHALWAGLRALEESSELRRRMAKHARERGMDVIGRSYEADAAESEQRANVIRRVLTAEPRTSNDEATPIASIEQG